MLSLLRCSVLLFLMCLLAQTAVSRTIKSPGFDAKLAKIISQLEEEQGKNGTETPVVEKPAGPSGGQFLMYDNTDCKQTRARPPIIRPVDKCFNIEDSFNLRTEARCNNGTAAKIATFSTRSCKNPLEESFDQIETDVGRCQDTTGIASMIFWCDGPSAGLDLSENVSGPGRGGKGNNGSAAGAFTVLLIILFILLIGIITTMLKFRNLLVSVYNRVKALVRRNEGGQIQL